MIDRIVIENFKSLRKVDLSLGRLNLFIGANASGKSNFLDALRVLQGIGNGFTISEILDGKPKSATSEVWDGIRGGRARACFGGPGGSDAAASAECSSEDISIEARGTLEAVAARTWEFRIAFSPATGQVTQEWLKVGMETVYNSLPVTPARPHRSETYVGRQAPLVPFDGRRPALSDTESGHLTKRDSAGVPVAALFADSQRVDPSTALLRDYSRSTQVRRMGEHGENFGALVGTLCGNEHTKDAYLSWLQELRPEEVSDVGVLRGALDEPLFMLREGNRDVPAPVLSDGTLRFAALAAAFFQPDMPQIMTVEEMENGVHPSRLRLIMELFRSQAERTGTQVFATTHSPLVLAWLQEEEYETTFFCRRNEQTGESEIRPLTDVPRLMDVVGKPGQHLADLFAEGWLEAVS